MVDAMINPELKERPFEQFILDLEAALNAKVENDTRRVSHRRKWHDAALALVFFLTGMFWRTLFDWIF